MKIFQPRGKIIFPALLIILLCISCAESSLWVLENKPETFTEEAVPYKAPPLEPVPEEIAVPPVPEYILGQGLVLAQNLSDFLFFYNPEAKESSGELAELYVEEAAIEGINHDAAFAQMCLETGFLRYGGLVTPDMNNFCGLGAIGSEQRGVYFPDKRTGVRAHIQHLKAYATEEPLMQELVDPRFFFVRSGSSPRISGLSGTWAADRQYAEKIHTILQRLYEFSFKDTNQPLEKR